MKIKAVISIVTLALGVVVAAVYALNHKSSGGLGNLFSGSQKKDAVESPNVDKFTRTAKRKTERVLQLLELIKYNVSLRGYVVRGLDWDNFPGLAETVAKMYPDGTQLLQVRVGEPAMLVTRKAKFTTTGQFILKVIRYTTWHTSLGDVPVFVDSPESEKNEAEWSQIRTDMRELTLQYLEEKLPEEYTKTKVVGSSALNKPSLTALHFLNDIGNRKGEESDFFTYQFARNLVLCSILKDYKMNAKSWKDEYTKLALTNDKKYDVNRLTWCADGGPFTNQDNVQTFETCMCDQDPDPFILSDDASRKRFSKLLASLDKQNDPTGATSGSATAVRAPASTQDNMDLANSDSSN